MKFSIRKILTVVLCLVGLSSCGVKSVQDVNFQTKTGVINLGMKYDEVDKLIDGKKTFSHTAILYRKDADQAELETSVDSVLISEKYNICFSFNYYKTLIKIEKMKK